LGVLTDWKNGAHLLTYRQTEYTFRVVARALAKHEPVGLPSPELQAACDGLLEASGPEELKAASASLAVAWTDLELISPPPAPGGARARRRSGAGLGPPQEQPAAQSGRAVFRLLLLRRDHGARGERRGSPRTPPAHDPVFLPPRPRPRPGPGPDRDAGARHPA